ncbi:MAG: GIY-YIG nuclease family protein [Cyclobacteriaceae bacterium]|nr:GIY-YIG nuclease family protein [Cyclobacteriaceae bacterium]
MYFIYIIKSQRTNRLYKGMSESPERRLLEHNGGKVKSTKGFGPWKIVYTEKFPTREEAIAREKFLKTGQGRDFIKSLGL